MPNLTDLRDAFARLEQEIPDAYRSPIVDERLAQLRAARPIGRRWRQYRTTVAVVLAAAAVVAVAVALVPLFRHNTHSPAGPQNSTGISTTPPPSPTSSPSRTRHTSAPQTSTLPANAAALLRYVRGGTPVTSSDYEKGASAPGQPLTPTPGVAEFVTPSGNITCGIVGADDVECSVDQHSWSAPPRPSGCQLNWSASWLTLNTGAVIRGACLGGPPFAPYGAVLPYGSTLQDGSITCRSESAFLACANVATGHGFAVNRSSLRTY